MLTIVEAPVVSEVAQRTNSAESGIGGQLDRVGRLWCCNWNPIPRRWRWRGRTYGWATTATGTLSPGGDGLQVGTGGFDDIVVVAGSVVYPSIHIKSSRASRFTIRYVFYTAGGAVVGSAQTLVSAERQVAADTHVRLQDTAGIVVPATATRMPHPRDSGHGHRLQPAIVGRRAHREQGIHRAGRLLRRLNPTKRPHGNTRLVHKWDGTVNASASTEYLQTLDLYTGPPFTGSSDITGYETAWLGAINESASTLTELIPGSPPPEKSSPGP